MAERAIAELGGVRNLVLRGPRPEPPSRARCPTSPRRWRRSRPSRARRRRSTSRREGRHQEGLRRRAGRPRRARRPRRRAGRRGQQLHLRRRVHAGLPRPVLRDVHRRAAAGGGGHRAGGPRLPAVRVHVRGVPHPRLRLHPDGRDLRGGPAAGRLARGRRDRRRRPVADGAGGPGDDAGRARLDRALPERRHQHGGAGRRDGQHLRASATCAPPAAATRGSTRRGRSSRSAGPSSFAPAKTIRSPWSAPG